VPLNLTINGNLSIDATSSLGAAGRGPRPSPAGNGGLGFVDFGPRPGGGGHGGDGGAGQGFTTPPAGAPGLAHGDPNNPVTFGGAGGPGSWAPGMRGGGVIHLITNSPISLDGVITADGVGAAYSAGAGAGGSVWIQAPSISGSGSITARGGAGSSGAGAGGGGRIRIDTCSLAIPAGNILVSGANPGSIVSSTTPMPPTITLQPVGANFVDGSTVQLTVRATPEPLTYQWRRDGVHLTDDKVISGSSTHTLTIAGISCNEHTGSYDVVVTRDVLCEGGVAVSDPATLHPAADWSFDNVVNSTDVSLFVNDWFDDQATGRLVTDFNHDGVSNSTDVSDFINNWFLALANTCGT
jgi:hypothetical protein